MLICSGCGQRFCFFDVFCFAIALFCSSSIIAQFFLFRNFGFNCFEFLINNRPCAAAAATLEFAPNFCSNPRLSPPASRSLA
jgi:hypothetical protein